MQCLYDRELEPDTDRWPGELQKRVSMFAQDKENTHSQHWLFASQTSMLQVTPFYRAEMVEGAGARPGHVVCYGIHL